MASAWLVAALLLAMLAACSDAGILEAGDAAPGQGVYVGAEWQTARAISGHQVHVVSKQIPCVKCHDITKESIGPVTPQRCAACHQKQARIEHATAQARERFGPSAKTDCMICHAFTLESAGHAGSDGLVHASDCNRCHLQRQGKLPGVSIHGTSKCVECHRVHEDDKPKTAPCVDCHQDVANTHAARGQPATDACTACHQLQHAPASEARPTCVPCHAKEKPIVPVTALFPEGHTECVACHRPHEFDEKSATPCRSCHEHIAVLGTPRVKQHAQCKSCHAPHDVSGSPERACAGCHRDKHPDHPRRGVVGTCVGCHDPHPPSALAHNRVRNCSSCHQIAASDKDFHGGTPCRQCHKPHDFVLQPSDHSACQACHAKELARVVVGHQECRGCHGGLPHRPSALGKGCESCHGAQSRAVAAGHSQCNQCHEPHSGTAVTTCQSCHKEEHRSAPSGHQVCKSCHQSHSGSTAKVACATCHAAESKTPHAGVAQGCASCHRAHGPKGTAKPPACTSCHQMPTLSGLHRVTKHEECVRCHTGHGEMTQASARTACLGCHTDRRNHFPDAPRCANCHLFVKTR